MDGPSLVRGIWNPEFLFPARALVPFQASPFFTVLLVGRVTCFRFLLPEIDISYLDHYF